MKCMYCGGDMEKTKSSYTIDRKGYHLFIKDVPVYICTRCGEKSYEEAEVDAIQNMIKSLEAELERVRVAV